MAAAAAAGSGRRVLSFPVLAVLSLIGFVYYSTLFVFLDQRVVVGGLRGPTCMLNAVPFTFLAFMCLVSFLAAVFVDPGHVPPSFSPEIEDPPQKTGMQPKHCDRCCTYKPPRAHHCRVCKRCVLKMDHHCLWINNCVGYRNYKPFIIFVLYASVASIYSTVIFLGSITHSDRSLALPHMFFYILCGSVCILLSLILGTLLGWHIYLICRNLTTIEYRGEIRAIWLAKKSGQKYRHPFNVGFSKNIALVLGPNILKWFWPLALGHLKDGLQFPVYHD